MVSEEQLLEFVNSHAFYCYTFGGAAIAWVTKRYVDRSLKTGVCDKLSRAFMCSLVTIIAAYCADEYIPDFHQSLILVIGAVVGSVGYEGIGTIMRKIIILRTGIDIGADVKELKEMRKQRHGQDAKPGSGNGDSLKDSQAGGLFDKINKK